MTIDPYPAADYRPIAEAPRDGKPVRLYWPRIMVDDDGEPMTLVAMEMGAYGVGVFVGGWPTREYTDAELADGAFLDWIYGSPSHWKPLFAGQ